MELPRRSPPTHDIHFPASLHLTTQGGHARTVALDAHVVLEPGILAIFAVAFRRRCLERERASTFEVLKSGEGALRFPVAGNAKGCSAGEIPGGEASPFSRNPLVWSRMQAGVCDRGGPARISSCASSRSPPGLRGHDRRMLHDRVTRHPLALANRAAVSYDLALVHLAIGERCTALSRTCPPASTRSWRRVAIPLAVPADDLEIEATPQGHRPALRDVIVHEDAAVAYGPRPRDYPLRSATGPVIMAVRNSPPR